MKDGIYTTEFWISLIATVGAAGIALAVSYGALSNEQAAAWQGVIAAVAPLVAVVVVGWIAKAYGANRTALKLQAVETEREVLHLESAEPHNVARWLPAGPPVEVSVTHDDNGQTWVWRYEEQ